jgi:hypothetical protein
MIVCTQIVLIKTKKNGFDTDTESWYDKRSLSSEAGYYEYCIAVACIKYFFTGHSV